MNEFWIYILKLFTFIHNPSSPNFCKIRAFPPLHELALSACPCQPEYVGPPAQSLVFEFSLVGLKMLHASNQVFLRLLPRTHALQAAPCFTAVISEQAQFRHSLFWIGSDQLWETSRAEEIIGPSLLRWIPLMYWLSKSCWRWGRVTIIVWPHVQQFIYSQEAKRTPLFWFFIGDSLSCDHWLWQS